MFCPRTGPSLQAQEPRCSSAKGRSSPQTQEPRLQPYPKAGLPLKLRNQGCSSAQRQIFHRKLRNQGCNSAQRQVFHCKLRNKGCISAEGRSSTANSVTKAVVLLGMNRCGSFPLLSASAYVVHFFTEITGIYSRGLNVSHVICES